MELCCCWAIFYYSDRIFFMKPLSLSLFPIYFVVLLNWIILFSIWMSSLAQTTASMTINVTRQKTWTEQSRLFTNVRHREDYDSPFITFYVPLLFLVDQAHWILAIREHIIKTALRRSVHSLHHLSEPRQVISTEGWILFTPLLVFQPGQIQFKQEEAHKGNLTVGKDSLDIWNDLEVADIWLHDVFKIII